MLETNLDYQICFFALFLFCLAAVLLLPTPDERRLERHQPIHDTTKTRRMP
jgi:hypothetical protein